MNHVIAHFCPLEHVCNGNLPLEDEPLCVLGQGIELLQPLYALL